MAPRRTSPLLLGLLLLAAAGAAWAVLTILLAEPPGPAPVEPLEPAGMAEVAPPELPPPAERQFREAPPVELEPGVILGRVVDRDRRPLEGARVEVARGAPAVVPGLRIERESLGLHDVSDANGRFRVADVPVGDDRVLLVSGDFLATEAGPLLVSPAHETDVGDVIVHPGLGISGWVYGEDGGQLAGARVALYRGRAPEGPTEGERTPEAVTTTDAEGRFAFSNQPRLDVSLEVTKAGYAAALVWVRHGPDVLMGRVDDVKVSAHLRRPTPLVGRIVNLDGGPVPPTEVIAFNSELGSTNGRSSTTSAPDGTFAFADLARGFYRLSADPEGLLATSTLVSEKQFGAEAVLETSLAGGLHARVVDQDGAPVRRFDLVVRHSRTKDKGIILGTVRRVRDDQGAFELDDLEPGFYTFVIWAPGFALEESTGHRVRKGKITKGVTITLGQGAVIAGEVVDDLGDPVAGARVALHDQQRVLHMALRATEKDEDWFASGFTSEEGLFELVDVTPRTYQLSVDHPDFPIVYRDPVAALEGERTEVPTIVLPRPGIVRGTVYHPDGQLLPRATVTLARGEKASRTVRSDADGEFVFERVLPGRYEIHALSDAPSIDNVLAAGFGRLLELKEHMDAGGSFQGMPLHGVDVGPGQDLRHDVTADG